MLITYAGIVLGQVFFWKFVYSSDKIPTIRFTVTTWHQRPLMVQKSLAEHIASPFFYMALLFNVVVLLKVFFYMSTFQVQLTILLIPTKRQITPEDFSYEQNGHFDEEGNGINHKPNLGPQYDYNNGRNRADSIGDSPDFMSPFSNGVPIHPSSSRIDSNSAQFFSHVPFFAEQPGGNSSNDVTLRQFIYNPVQPEIFLTDLQEMMYLLIPVAALITIFWMRSSMSDRKISTSLLFSSVSLFLWGVVQYSNLSFFHSLTYVEIFLLFAVKLWPQ
jgi:hypothetical protein